MLGPKLCSKRAEPSGLKGDKHLEYFRNKEGDLKNIGKIPIKHFMDKIVIITNVDVDNDDQLKLSRMGEVLDVCFVDFKIGQPYKYPLDIDEKKEPAKGNSPKAR